VSEQNLSERFIGWAQREPSIRALTLIGSRARPSDAPDAGDEHSDWDFQVVSSEPRQFETRDWIDRAGLGPVLAFVWRGGRLGSARKATALFADGELDVIVISSRQLALVRWLLRLGLARRIGAVDRAMTDLATVLRGGYGMLKGEREWGGFFSRVASSGRVARLSDDDVRNLADGFVCDYQSTRKKIDRGELLAAQRWLHHQLAEANFALLHELRQRRGTPSYPDARRLETSVDKRELGAVRVAALPTAESLRAAIAASAQTCRELAHELVGSTWQWPEAIE